MVDAVIRGVLDSLISGSELHSSRMGGVLLFPTYYCRRGMLGKGHAILLKRAELKTFVNFHGNEAEKGGDLTHDETTIITGALELIEKTAKDAMTPISNAFSLDLDANLNLETLNSIMTMGHSRVPIYAGNPRNIIRLILVKNLLAVDLDDAVPLRKMIPRKIPRNFEFLGK
ncbi:hypothetical protein G4B88_025773 [Cannabis sativa]|uniref:Uncharacterized protein n=1 Tax=Cannabis sativa TaxID=3483 RepID=A0A7J6F5W2_CANSA|nr:hypothetical protein G4B88_025773 [Cannabis sativa]